MENSAVQAISQFPKAVFGVRVVTNTEPKMRKTNNPYIGRVRKLTEYSNAMLGVDYQNAVNNRLERAGFEADYKAEAPKGKKHYNSFFYQSLKDESVFYLKIGFYKNKGIKRSWLVDGREATEQEINEFSAFLQESSNEGVKKQEEAGLSVEEQYTIVAPKLENVVSVTLGERVVE